MKCRTPPVTGLKSLGAKEESLPYLMKVLRLDLEYKSHNLTICALLEAAYWPISLNSAHCSCKPGFVCSSVSS
jgi:hypothetical protein